MDSTILGGEAVGGRVVVTGAAGAVGRRLLSRLADALPESEVVAVDRRPADGADAWGIVVVDLSADDLSEVLRGATAVVHLATTTQPDVDDPDADERELVIVERVLAAAGTAEVAHVVVVSTAMVYGAWVGNPVPLTEDAPLRPNPDFAWATVRAGVEQRAREWAEAADRSVAVLRPTAVVADDALGQLARVLHAARLGIAAEGDPPVQYLHVDDLAAALALVVAVRFDGVANVAPDGWIPPDQLGALEGPTARLRLPGWVVRLIAALRSRWGLSPIPPGIVPYTSHSWVVSNDRIRSLGWEPIHSNEEAWVVSHEPRTFDRLSARRRQELALAAVALLVTVIAGLLAALAARFRRR